MGAADQILGLYPRAPRWRGLLARLTRQFAVTVASGRSDVVARPCAWCPPTPPPEPVTRPCALCRREQHREVQSPEGVLVNGEYACRAHHREVERLRGLMQTPEAWERHLAREQADAERQVLVAAHAYHRRRAERIVERANV